ncbi:MAG: hypothetical protein SNJ73_02270 [Acetobacteraceae bacterium]
MAEFGIVGGAFTLLLIALLELGWQFAVAAALEFGVREAALQCSAGAACTRASVAAEIERRAVILDRTKLGISADRYGAEAWPTEPCRFVPPGAGEVVPVVASDLTRFCISYRQPWLTPIGIAWSGGDGAIDHRVVALVRNEPF